MILLDEHDSSAEVARMGAGSTGRLGADRCAGTEVGSAGCCECAQGRDRLLEECGPGRVAGEVEHGASPGSGEAPGEGEDP